MFLSKAGLIFDGQTVRAQSRDPRDLKIAVSDLVQSPTRRGFEEHELVSPARTPLLPAWKQTKPPAPAAPVKLDEKAVPLAPDDADFDQRAGVWQVSVPKDALANVHDVFLRVDYVGDAGRAYLGDRFVDDDFYFGRPWEIGLRRFAPDVLAKGLTFKILPLRKDAPLYIPHDRLPDFGAADAALTVRSITLEAEYEATFQAEPGK